MSITAFESLPTHSEEPALASARNGISRRHVVHFGDQEYAVALTGNHAADQFLGSAVAVYLRRVDHRHPERKACAQRFFLSGLRMSSLRETCRALAECWDNCPIGELYRGGCSTSRCT